MKIKHFHIERVTSAVILSFLAYIPWHDALFLGQRPMVKNTDLAFLYSIVPLPGGLTTSGLFNGLWLCVLSLSLAHTFFKQFQARRIQHLFLLVWSWPIWIFFNTRFWSAEAIVVMGNAYLFTLLLSLLLIGEDLPWLRSSLQRFGLFTMTVSFGLALLLPILISPSSYSPFLELGGITRYRGYLGEGLPLALGGVALCTWGLLTIVHHGRVGSLAILSILFGMFGVVSSHFEIGLVAVVASALGATWLSSYKPTRIKGIYILCGSVLLVSLYFWFSRNLFGTFGDARSSHALLQQWKHAPLFGSGTGYAKRFLESSGFNKGFAPGSDYLRLLVEHGFLGLLLFLIVIGGVVRAYCVHAVTVLLICMMTLMGFYFILIVPTFGYGPLLLAGFIAPPVKLKRFEIDRFLEFLLLVIKPSRR